MKVGEFEVKCEYDDQKVQVDLAGETYHIECPRKAVLCPNMVCPADCEGKEVCNWNLQTPKCEPRYKGVTMLGPADGVTEPTGELNEFLPFLKPVGNNNDGFGSFPSIGNNDDGWREYI